MRKKIILLLIFVGVIFAGEWNFIREPLSGGFGGEYSYWRIPDVFFLPGTREGWVCGFAHPAHTMNGVSHTTDGGYTWEPQATPYWPSYLNRVFFLNQNYGWVVGGYSITGGYNPILMRTTNGGQTWQGQDLPYGHNLWAVYFVDELNGFAGGIAGLFLRTDDGGVTWEYVSVPLNYYITNLFFKDRYTGFASGFDIYQPEDTRGRIWKTTDAGNSWSELNIPTCTDIYAMFVLDSLKGWFVPRKYYPAYCYFTTDGGITWNQSSSYLEPGAPPNSIIFSDSLNGWIAGGYSPMSGFRSALWRTTDGGNNWVKQYSPSANGFWSISAASDSEAVAVGFNTILHTTDGGNYWEYQNSGDLIWEICAPDTLHLFACAWSGVLIKSSDAGATWQCTNIDSAKGIQLYSISFPTPNIGWVGGAGILKKTTDSGQTWIDQNPINPGQGYYSSMQFIDTLNGWVGGNLSYVLFQTTDGGNSWIRHDLPWEYELNAVEFVDTLYGWAVGTIDSSFIYKPLIVHTTDGGQTWNRQSLTPSGSMLNACDFISRTHGWAGGSALYTTTDGGQTWALNTDVGSIYSVGLADSLNGWVVSSGEIYHSTDGGASFNMEFEWEWGGTNAQGMTVIDSSHAWVCWDYGFVLKYTPETGIDEQKKYISQANPLCLMVTPNPCQRLAAVTYNLVLEENISLSLFDVSGRLRKPLFKGIQKAGEHTFQLDAEELPSGIYFLRLETKNASSTYKVIIFK
jgi:photosystem II stability/assembly factor-like uncharacterized protein